MARRTLPGQQHASLTGSAGARQEHERTGAQLRLAPLEAPGRCRADVWG